MKLLILALAAGVAAIPQVAAAVDASPLQLRPKAALVGATTPGHQSAPFVNPTLAAEPALDLAPHSEERQRNRSACESDRTLCYDAGHIVFKPARQLMPDIPGLRRENIIVKRDRVILKYSF